MHREQSTAAFFPVLHGRRKLDSWPHVQIQVAQPVKQTAYLLA